MKIRTFARSVVVVPGGAWLRGGETTTATKCSSFRHPIQRIQNKTLGNSQGSPHETKTANLATHTDVLKTIADIV
jgi:hypothetical protein